MTKSINGGSSEVILWQTIIFGVVFSIIIGIMWLSGDKLNAVNLSAVSLWMSSIGWTIFAIIYLNIIYGYVDIDRYKSEQFFLRIVVMVVIPIVIISISLIYISANRPLRTDDYNLIISLSLISGVVFSELIPIDPITHQQKQQMSGNAFIGWS